jgi:hypothetical protein
MEAERFAESALNTIADDGSADSTRDGESQPRTAFRNGFGTRPAKGGEQRAGDAEALVIDKPEFGGAENPGRPRKGARGVL